MHSLLAKVTTRYPQTAGQMIQSLKVAPARPRQKSNRARYSSSDQTYMNNSCISINLDYTLELTAVAYPYQFNIGQRCRNLYDRCYWSFTRNCYYQVLGVPLNVMDQECS